MWVATSRSEGEIQAAPNGLDTARFLMSALLELLFGNGNSDVETIIRNDNASAVGHVHSINSERQERRSNGSLASNMRNRERIHG